MTAVQSCSYCGLPLASGWWNWRRRAKSPAVGDVAQDSPQAAALYCCSGCRFAAEVMAERQAGSPINKPVARLGIAIFLTVNVVMFTMVLWSNDVYSTAPSGGVVAPAAVAAPIIGDKLDDVIRWLVLVLERR